jgi:hypothetical protein
VVFQNKKKDTDTLTNWVETLDFTTRAGVSASYGYCTDATLTH